MAIEQAQATGYSFTPQKVTGGVEVKDPLAGVATGLSNLLGKYAKAKQGNEADFLEGMVDHAAGTIKEQSWLTPDLYNQGLAYSKFIDKQSSLTAALPQLAQETLGAGGDLDAYKAKLKPVLADLAKSLEESGLEGDALVAAQKQNITFVAAAMQTYQSNREVKLQQDLNTATYQINNSSVNMWLAAGGVPEEFEGFMGGALQQISSLRANSNDKDPVGTASAAVADTIKALAGRANPATPEGQRAIQAIAMFTNSGTAQRMSPKAYNDIQEVLSKKQQDVMSYNSNMLTQEVMNAERAYAAGELSFTSKDFTDKYKAIDLQVASGVIEVSAGTALKNRIMELEKKALKEGQESTVALTGDFNARTAVYGTDADSKSADSIVKQAAKQFGSDYDKAAKFIIGTGVRTQNGAAITQGFRQYASQMDVLFSMNPDDLAKGDADGTHVAAYQGYVRQVQALQAGNQQHFLRKALEAISDPDTRDAVEMYFSTGKNVGANTQFDLKEIQRYKDQIITTRQSGGVNGAASKGSGFTAEDLKSGFFATHVWPLVGTVDSGKPSSWWSNPSDDVLAYQAAELNRAWDSARGDVAVAERNGSIFISPEQKIRFLRETGRVIPIDTGIVTANKGWRDSLRFANDDKRYITDEGVTLSLQVIRDRYFNKFNGYGDRKFKKEDIRMSVVGNQLLISATDKQGKGVAPLQRYGQSVIGETAWQIAESRKKDGGKLPIGSVGVGSSKLNVTRDWVHTFGDELAMQVASSIYRFEGNTQGVSATDKSRPNVQTTGIGILVSKHPEWAKKVLEAQRNGDASAVTGEFVKDYFKTFDKMTAAAELPKPERLNYTGMAPAYVGLANAMWQAGATGGGNSYSKILRVAKTDYDKAVAMFKQSPMYKEIANTPGVKDVDKHPRVQMYIDGIRSVYGKRPMESTTSYKKQNNSGIIVPSLATPAYPLQTSGSAGFN